tara:strand:- start:1264 stop:1677 length:414 start_codon:yes stop_codon:yes gene_type:complete
MLSKVSLRLKLSDFINTEFEEKVMNMINTTHKELNVSVLLYLWFDEKVDGLKDFLIRWEDKLHFKTIVKNNSIIGYDEFIFFDIVPTDMTNNSQHRFKYTYDEPTKITSALDKFYEITKFITTEKPIKKQKRNDYED